MTRRHALSLPLGALAVQTRAQNRGMASRGAAPAPKGKPSGKPFHVRFVNVARAAGLRSPVIYGPADHADYLLETIGCGAAFLAVTDSTSNSPLRNGIGNWRLLRQSSRACQLSHCH